jgi:hypothetical protein
MQYYSWILIHDILSSCIDRSLVHVGGFCLGKVVEKAQAGYHVLPHSGAE